MVHSNSQVDETLTEMARRSAAEKKNILIVIQEHSNEDPDHQSPEAGEPIIGRERVYPISMPALLIACLAKTSSICIFPI